MRISIALPVGRQILNLGLDPQQMRGKSVFEVFPDLKGSQEPALCWQVYIATVAGRTLRMRTALLLLPVSTRCKF